MLVGVALSAPAAARLSTRLDGRALLRVTCVTEAVLRVGTFALLLGGAPLVVVAASNVVAWTGYAGMRAEVAAADPRGVAMTWYMVAAAPSCPPGSSPPAPRSPGIARRPAGRRRLSTASANGLLASGALVMLLGSGPTLLAVGWPPSCTGPGGWPGRP
jgi:hypothetical protein